MVRVTRSVEAPCSDRIPKGCATAADGEARSLLDGASGGTCRSQAGRQALLSDTQQPGSRVLFQ